MFINKIGYDHLESGMNCQDFGYKDIIESCICDGCSEGQHSEVGAKLFCHLMQHNEFNYNQMFCMLRGIIGINPQYLKDFLSFTIMHLIEDDYTFLVNYCGDGYIILQDYDDNITFEKIDDGEYPKYYIYNFIDSKYLKHYKDGVDFSSKEYSKEQYKRVGIASDGLRFIVEGDDELKDEFVKCLQLDKELKVKLFINRNHKIFKDDITIAF